jgi:PIN domain nuclease of toxin-antitoxin system
VAVVVLDASVLIAFLDPVDANHPRARAALAAHQSDDLVLPASVFAEVLVGPYRHGAPAVGTVEQFVADLAMRIQPITADIARRAAFLRSRYAALKLPDAFVLGTGDVLDASTVLTADQGWPKVSPRAHLI